MHRPDQNESARQMTARVLEGCDYGLAFYPALKVAFVDPAQECQTYGCRKHPPVTSHIPQHWAATDGAQQGHNDSIPQGKKQLADLYS
jgi:hypothetical protein